MININLIGKSITGNYGDKQFAVSFSKEKYDLMLTYVEKAASASTIDELKRILEEFEPLTKESRKELVETKNPFIYVNENTGKYYMKTQSGLISNVAMPISLVNRINEALDKGVSFDPLIKMWTRFLRNKKANIGGFASKFVNYINMTYMNPKIRDEYMNKDGLTYEKAAELATVYQVKVTQEGLLNCFKVSSEILVKYEASEDGEPIQKRRYLRTFDPNTGEITSEGIPDFVEDRVFQPAVMGTRGDAFSCGDTIGHIIKVGQVHALDSWDKVNCNDSQSCVPGLHVGGLDYIKGIGGEIHNVFVDPMLIGAIPDDNTGAMRVKEYFVHSSLAGLNKNLYHSSNYAQLTDRQWEEMREEIINNLGQLIVDQKGLVNIQVDQLNSL